MAKDNDWVGRTMIVFDPREWEQAGYDQPEGNGRFYHRATILSVSRTDGYRELIATIRFHHDGRISKGHFIDGMQEVPS